MEIQFIEIHFTNDGMLGLTLHEWREYLDTFNLDDAHILFYSILDKKTRDLMHHYWKKRMFSSRK